MNGRGAGGAPAEPFRLDGEMPEPRLPARGDVSRLLAGLAYASQVVLPAVMPIVLLVSDEARRSEYLRYHAVQSLALFVASILYYLVATVAYALVSIVMPMLACVSWLVFMVPGAGMLYYGYLAYRDGYVEIPWLTAFLKRNAWL